MPLYVADYLADTAHLAAAEHGAYLLLIMAYWRNGSLPADEKMLQRISRMSQREWAKSREVVLALFADKSPWDNFTAVEHALGIGRRDIRPAISKEIREIVFNSFNGVCAYCGTDNGPFEIDHVVPYSRGGAHSIENFALSCSSCNRSKGARFVEEWAQ